jgi:hypothetical protein
MGTLFEEIGYLPNGRPIRGAAANGARSDAPPSNRASDSCNQDSYTLLSGHVDTLELSYRGTLQPEVDGELENLKHHAQSREDRFQALAQFCRGDAVTLPRFHVHQTHAAFRLRSKSAGDR